MYPHILPLRPPPPTASLPLSLLALSPSLCYSYANVPFPLINTYWSVEACIHIHEPSRIPPGYWCCVCTFSEERCLRSLGTIPWLGAHRHNTKKILHSQSGKQCLLLKKRTLICSWILCVKHAYLSKTRFRKNKATAVNGIFFTLYCFRFFFV
jgi:hypothetical protein